MGGKKQKKKEEAPQGLAINYARVLFNLMISLNNQFKVQFIEEQGIHMLRKVLKKAFAELDFEIYFYCLGTIPALIHTYPQQKKAFLEQGYCSLL